MADFVPELTQDGSSSFFNKQFNESYHSSVGAYTEALHKHVLACKIPELAAAKDELLILDLCFGLGYNTGLAILEARKSNPNVALRIFGLESDPKIIEEITNLEVPNDYQPIKTLLSNLAFSSEYNRYELATELRYQGEISHLSIDVLIGDARKTVLAFPDESFDAVFFDPFSPKVCPELWQKDFIQNVVDKTKSGAYISTYSSSRLAKEAFLAAGTQIEEGPKLNRRNGGVVAQKQ